MKTDRKDKANDDSKEEVKLTCGIIMPISANESYAAQHWTDVKLILEETIIDSGFSPNMVSDADDVGIIHNRIVSNLYNNPIVVCDVSSKNPNVMFELGLRLAFDRATIIIKDDHTSYNFDTAPIEHLTYPRDLRYGFINAFEKKLSEKLKATYDASQTKGYSAFLKNFVQYKPVLDVKEISSQEFILKTLESLSRQVSEIRNNILLPSRPGTNQSDLAVSVMRRNDVVRALNDFIKVKQINGPDFFKSKAIYNDFVEFARIRYSIDLTDSEMAYYFGESLAKLQSYEKAIKNNDESTFSDDEKHGR